MEPQAPALQLFFPHQTGVAERSVGGGERGAADDVLHDVVEGDLVRPDGEFVDTRKGAKHSSLIKIRENFIPEMIKSAEDI